MNCTQCGFDNLNSAKYCSECGTKFAIKRYKKIKYYMHSNKDSNYELASDYGLSGIAKENFMHAMYEVEFDLKLDMTTGEVEIIGVDGMKVVNSGDDKI